MATVQLVSFDPFAVLADARGIPFADARVLQHLRRMTLLAAVVPEGRRVALRSLELRVGVLHDAVLAPGAQIAGDARSLAYVQPAHWLHISADPRDEPWAGAVQALGARVVFVPRGGLRDPLGLELLLSTGAAGAVTVLSDLWQLADHVAAINGPPVRYEVRIEAAAPDVLARFAHWLRYEHGADHLAVRGCLGFEVMQESLWVLRQEYLFVNAEALAGYLAGPEAALRQKTRERFRDTELIYGPSQSVALGGFGGHERRHFI